MEELSFQQKLQGDYYKNKLEYPAHRRKPGILSKKIDLGSLTPEEVAAAQGDKKTIPVVAPAAEEVKEQPQAFKPAASSA